MIVHHGGEVSLMLVFAPIRLKEVVSRGKEDICVGVSLVIRGEEMVAGYYLVVKFCWRRLTG